MAARARVVAGKGEVRERVGVERARVVAAKERVAVAGRAWVEAVERERVAVAERER